ncbi:MAG: hypothetical protein B7Y70_01125 [Rhizobiales bacterium 35-68-8]|nr:MAG: hypothetical protein B7Y70_01125 [Rhizobiales bacterium 35-68-8]
MVSSTTVKETCPVSAGTFTGTLKNFVVMVFGLGPSCTTAMRIGTLTAPAVPLSPRTTRPSMPTFMVMVLVDAVIAHSRARLAREPW